MDEILKEKLVQFLDAGTKSFKLYTRRSIKDWKVVGVIYEHHDDCELFIGSGSEICKNLYDNNRNKDSDANVLPSKQAAEAHLALMQLHQLRDCWREGWLPDWKDENQDKYVIFNPVGGFRIGRFSYTKRFLAFQDEKRANEFLTNFRELIEEAGDLI